MGEAARHIGEVMGERMALVTEVASLNARMLRNSQLLGGIEIELLACHRALAEAQAREQEIRAEVARDEQLSDELDERLAALDRELAGM